MKYHIRYKGVKGEIIEEYARKEIIPIELYERLLNVESFTYHIAITLSCLVINKDMIMMI